MKSSGTAVLTIPAPGKWIATNQHGHHWNLRHLWDNRSAPGGAGNTTRGLTRSLDLTKEGLA